MDNIEKSLLIDPYQFHFVIQKCRDFFIKQGFIETHPQNRLSILAACEDPTTITTFNINHKTYPLPQTGQMCLEQKACAIPFFLKAGQASEIKNTI
jgi:aspartyl/asparaginyl-tRNA synthetase